MMTAITRGEDRPVMKKRERRMEMLLARRVARRRSRRARGTSLAAGAAIRSPASASPAAASRGDRRLARRRDSAARSGRRAAATLAPGIAICVPVMIDPVGRRRGRERTTRRPSTSGPELDRLGARPCRRVPTTSSDLARLVGLHRGVGHQQRRAPCRRSPGACCRTCRGSGTSPGLASTARPRIVPERGSSPLSVKSSRPCQR